MTDPETITNCQLAYDRLSVFKDCMETYEMDDNAPGSEWPWNVLSTQSVGYECGQIARKSSAIHHIHDKNEKDLCIALATEVAEIMSDCDIGMGSESSDSLSPYYRVALLGESSLEHVTPDLIRDAFGGTIYPPTKISIEPLKESGDWWRQVVTYGDDDESYLKPWCETINWFHTNSFLRSPSFVMIGDDPLDPQMTNGGCVFPRLAVGLTVAGSLVGIGGWVVYT